MQQTVAQHRDNAGRLMDIDLTPEEDDFRMEVRHFLRAHLTEELRQRAASSPSVFVEPDIGQTWNAMLHSNNWLGYQWPEDCGGTGWTPVQRYLFEKECALAGAPTLTALSLKLVAPVIYTFGSEAQKSYYLPRILTGEDYWCQGFSEPGAGSDLASLQCRAIREGDHYIVSGSKLWTTHAHHANKMFCLVRTDAAVRPQAGITFLLIDMRQEGVSVRPISTLAGDKEVNQVFLDNVVVPVEDRVGEEGQGWTIAKFLLENERAGSCHAPELLAQIDNLESCSLGEPDGRGCLLGHDPDWSRRLAAIRLRGMALEMLELRILFDLANGRAPGPQTSLVKLLASNLRQDISLLSVDLYGDAGLELETRRPLDGQELPPPIHSQNARMATPRYLNSRSWTIFGGTNEVQAGIVAKTVLGL